MAGWSSSLQGRRNPRMMLRAEDGSANKRLRLFGGHWRAEPLGADAIQGGLSGIYMLRCVNLYLSITSGSFRRNFNDAIRPKDCNSSLLRRHYGGTTLGSDSARPADIAAAGIKLAAINTPEHARKVAEILGDDANLLAPLLPYSVLLVNGSTKRLRGIGIFFRWENPEIAPRAYGLILSRGLDPEYSLRLPLPGEIKMFTPSPSATGYLSIPPPRRRQPLSGSTVTMATSFQDALQQDISRLSKYTNFRASIDGVLFEDYLYVGLSNVFGIVVLGNSI